MKKLFFLLITLLCSYAIDAQNETNSTKAEINKIKRSQSYLSAEATMNTPEEAQAVAKELLVSEINEWIASKKEANEVKQVVLQDINLYTEKMDMKRGVKTRAFVYVKKKDILLIFGDGQLILNEDEKGAELQALSNITNPLNKETQSKVNAVAADTTEDRLGKIVAAKTMADMKAIFAEYKAKNLIQYEAYKPEQVQSSCYLLFYNKNGEIQGVVKKEEEENYINVQSNQPVKLTDYNGCGAYWFILK